MLRQRGFSIVELMVAITIGLLISTGLSIIFVNSTKANQEVQRFGEQIENGRIAMDMFSQDLRTAGFFDTLDITLLTPPGALPDPCATAVATLKSAAAIHVQGYDNTDGALTCIDDYKIGTDVVVIRRGSTCVAGVGSCAAVGAGSTYFQVTQCAPTDGGLTQLNAPDIADQYMVATSTGDFTTFQRRDCITQANVRRYIVHIYYVANNTEGTDGIPALKMVELGAGSFNTNTPTVIAPGIEQLQVEYGADADANGTPDAYSATAPTILTAPTIVAVKANFLSRNTSVSPGYTDTKTYSLGNKADGTENIVPAANDKVRRHVYSSMVMLSNPAGLRGGG